MYVNPSILAMLKIWLAHTPGFSLSPLQITTLHTHLRFSRFIKVFYTTINSADTSKHIYHTLKLISDNHLKYLGSYVL